MRERIARLRRQSSIALSTGAREGSGIDVNMLAGGKDI